MAITKEEVRKALPVHLKNAATDSLVEALNTIPLDPEVADNIRNNFITYTSVLKDGRFKMEDYLNAVAYVSFKLMGYNNQESYSRTFPERYAALVAKGTSGKDIAAYVSAYNKNKLVTLILEQSMIPTWLLNADVFQSAINHQAYLMINAKSEMVQMQAAKALMDTLKRPEAKEVNLNLGATNESGVEELRGMMVELAKRQQTLIEAGASTREIAHQKLKVIDATAEVIAEEILDNDNG